MNTEPFIVEIESSERDLHLRRKMIYKVARHQGRYGVQWLSVKHGWLDPVKKNWRFYSRFSTKESALKTIAKAEGK